MDELDINELRDILIFQDLPDVELAWLLANSHEQWLASGDYFVRENELECRFYVVLEGELQVTRTVNGQPTVMGTTPPGIVGGELALLNRTPSQVTAQAIMPSRLLVLDERAFRESFANCPVFGSRIFQIAAERTQGYASYVKQQEKMAALGKLSAGLAHELNNPAAAARRAAQTLREGLMALHQRTMQLNTLGLNEQQLTALVTFQQQAAEQAANVPPLSPLEQSDREDALDEWLDEHGVVGAWEMTAAFVTAGVTAEQLNSLVASLPPDSVAYVVTWLYQALATAGLLEEIEQSTRRISDLVSAVKAYTYMDQAPTQQVDIHKGLENTLMVMKHKLQNIHLIRQYDPQLPTILARGSELNQVWTNLLDNAIDALNGTGKIWVITRYENNFVMVEIADDGPGIPEEVQVRLFEPFFTTKDVGIGTGLGLDISYRIIRQHNGTIEVRSEPGRTRFIVRLPVGSQ